MADDEKFPVDGEGLHRLPAQIVGQANRLHLVMLVLTLLMVPGALRALEPIDMEAYDMESPELNAQTTIDETFASSEVIVAFLVMNSNASKQKYAHCL